MINSRLRMQALAAVALAGIALFVACNNGSGGGGGGGSGNSGDTGDVLGVGNIGGKVNAVSGDGTAVVGSANVTGSTSEAFRWTQVDGMELLGFLSDVDPFSVAHGVSENGSVVVGFSNSPGVAPNFTNEAFRWAPSFGGNTMTGLGAIVDKVTENGPVFPPAPFSEAYAVSGDGTEVVGTSAFSTVEADKSRPDGEKKFESGRHAFRWKPFGVGLNSDADGDLQYGLVDGRAVAIFDPTGGITDGWVVGTGVSHTVTDNPDPAFFPWHKEAYFLRNGVYNPIGELTGGFVLPGDITCANPPCFAQGLARDGAGTLLCPECSVDGEIAHTLDSFANDVFVRRAPAAPFRTIVVVGASYRDDLAGSLPEAYRWQESRGFTLGGVDFRCAQDAVTFEPNGGAPFDKLCMQGLGDLPGGIKHSEAKAISGLDLSIDSIFGLAYEGGLAIVGFGHTAEGRRAFRWENTNVDLDLCNAPGTFFCDLDPTMPTPCMLDLKDWLESLPNFKYEAFDPGGWTFIEATDISDDGDVIVGNGINPNGEEEGFVIRLTRFVPNPSGP